MNEMILVWFLRAEFVNIPQAQTERNPNMTLNIQKGAFDGLSGALKDMTALNLWPTTYVSGEAPAADIHWHEYDVHVYVMKGQTYFVDGETGAKLPVVAGDRVLVPAKTLHAEGAVEDEVVYLIGLPSAVPPGEFLAMRDPALLTGQ